MMRLPPAEPTTKYRVLFDRNSTMVGDIDERGRFPGRMKLEGEGMKPKKLEELGIEKSFISLFMMTPVESTINCEPNKVLMVVVKLIAMPEASATTIWDVPGLTEGQCQRKGRASKKGSSRLK